MGQNRMPVLKFSAEGGGRQGFGDCRGDANEAFVGTAGRRGAWSRVGLDVADTGNSKN